MKGEDEGENRSELPDDNGRTGLEVLDLKSIYRRLKFIYDLNRQSSSGNTKNDFD